MSKHTKEDLIVLYEKRLEKVKEFWSKDQNTERGKEYIHFAEKDLQAVKDGRGW